MHPNSNIFCCSDKSIRLLQTRFISVTSKFDQNEPHKTGKLAVILISCCKPLRHRLQVVSLARVKTEGKIHMHSQDLQDMQL